MTANNFFIQFFKYANVNIRDFRYVQLRKIFFPKAVFPTYFILMPYGFLSDFLTSALRTFVQKFSLLFILAKSKIFRFHFGFDFFSNISFKFYTGVEKYVNNFEKYDCFAYHLINLIL